MPLISFIFPKQKHENSLLGRPISCLWLCGVPHSILTGRIFLISILIKDLWIIKKWKHFKFSGRSIGLYFECTCYWNWKANSQNASRTGCHAKDQLLFYRAQGLFFPKWALHSPFFSVASLFFSPLFFVTKALPAPVMPQKMAFSIFSQFLGLLPCCIHSSLCHWSSIFSHVNSPHNSLVTGGSEQGARRDQQCSVPLSLLGAVAGSFLEGEEKGKPETDICPSSYSCPATGSSVNWSINFIVC